MNQSQREQREEAIMQGQSLAEAIEMVAPQALKRLRPNERMKLQRQTLTTTVSRQEASFFSGPLPPPETLAAYDKILSGGADRLVGMAERQSNHRMELERKVISSQLLESRLGQIFGFVLGLTGLSLGSWVAVAGQPWAGASIAGTTLIGLVGVFVYGRKKQRQNLKEKEE
jgi:uncharacterized membrane protein